MDNRNTKHGVIWTRACALPNGGEALLLILPSKSQVSAHPCKGGDFGPSAPPLRTACAGLLQNQGGRWYGVHGGVLRPVIQPVFCSVREHANFEVQASPPAAFYCAFGLGLDSLPLALYCAQFSVAHADLTLA
jgi:hypothetical protein